MKQIITACLFMSSVLMYAQQPQQCLIVRQAEGHRFRNAMIAGALTGGIGLAAGGAFSGGRYEYIESFGLTGTKMKYKGPELQKLQEQGVHIITVNKKASGEEIKSARESCTTPTAPAQPAPAAVKDTKPQASNAQPKPAPAPAVHGETIQGDYSPQQDPPK
jgi:hypothetical protein